MILRTDPTPLFGRRHGEVTVSLPWFAARVRGPSMVPALRSGDAVLVRRTTHARPGEIVVARFRSRADLLVVKRAVRPADGGWWLASDNEFTADDSRAYGVADVIGRVLFRYWPRPSWFRRRGDGHSGLRSG